jgi:hypothetical protein
MRSDYFWVLLIFIIVSTIILFALLLWYTNYPHLIDYLFFTSSVMFFVFLRYWRLPPIERSLEEWEKLDELEKLGEIPNTFFFNFTLDDVYLFLMERFIIIFIIILFIIILILYYYFYKKK